MKYEADRMTNLKLTDELVLPERDVILEERRSRVGNSPASQLGEAMRAALFLNHPYRLPVIGWKQEIQSLTTADALAFYRRWYAPNNAVLIVAGDVSAEEVRRLAETYYGPLPAREIPLRRRPAEPEQTAARRVTLKSPRVGQPTLTIIYQAPSYSFGDREQAYALEVLDEILGGGPTSRLYRALVVEQAVAASAGTGYGATNLDQSTFSISASPRPGIEIEVLETALRQEISRLLEEGVGEAEVADAKSRLVAASVYARDSLSTGARIFGAALSSGLTVDEVESWPERIAAVSLDQVNAALRAVLDETRSVTGLLLPEPSS
jgi:zinc protease